MIRRAEVGLSVALCTWNGARWLRPMLESLAGQERLPDELVVQDDRSTDDTVDVLRAFATEAPFEVRIDVNDEHLGSTANFARAIEQARGRFIALADQDDIWYPAKLRRLTDELTEDPTLTLVFSDADLIGEDGRRLPGRLWDTRLVGPLLRRHPVVSNELFARRALTTGCTVVVRRRVAEAALPFPPELEHADAPMRHDRWLTLVAASVGTVKALPEPLLAFRVHPEQETGVLVGRQLGDALARTAARTLRNHDGDRADGLVARARQLRVAAERADLVGDFDEARALRRVAAGYELRAAIDRPGPGRLRRIAEGIRTGAYAHDPLAPASVAADVVRALRPLPAADGSEPRPGAEGTS